MNETAQRIIDAIRDNRTRFEAFCYALTPEQLARPVPESTWLVRDFVVHLTTLDPALDTTFRETAAGRGSEPPGGSAAFDVDAFNEAEVMARRDWPLSDVFAEGARNRARLVETIASLSDEQLEQKMYFAGDAKRGPGTIPLKLFLAGWAQHDPIHAFDMLRALPELADDPDVRAWVDNPFVKGYQAAMNPG